MQPSHTDVLIQWLMFFAFFGVILIPALMSRKIAVRYKKRGWLFFLMGLVTGFLSVSVGRLVLPDHHDSTWGAEIWNNPYRGNAGSRLPDRNCFCHTAEKKSFATAITLDSIFFKASFA